MDEVWMIDWSMVRQDAWDAQYVINRGLKHFKNKGDTFDMIQIAFEENDMHKVTVYKWVVYG